MCYNYNKCYIIRLSVNNDMSHNYGKCYNNNSYHISLSVNIKKCYYYDKCYNNYKPVNFKQTITLILLW